MTLSIRPPTQPTPTSEEATSPPLGGGALSAPGGRRTPLLSVLALLILPATLLLAAPEAEACSLGAENVFWSLPADGESILPETPILLGISGEPLGSPREVTLLHEDQEVVTELQTAYLYGLFSWAAQVQPDGSLIDGDYLLTVTYEDSEYSDDFSLAFTVDQSLDPGPAPGPVDFSWYQHTLAQPSGDSCYNLDEAQVLSIEPLADAPYYYEITFHREGQGPLPYLRRADTIGDQLHLFYRFDIDCVEVRGVSFNGVAGDSVEICQPDKCFQSDNTSTYVEFGDVDWDSVIGCSSNEAPVPGQPPANDGNDGRRGGCSTTGGSPAPAALLLLLVGAFLRRRN